MTGGPLKHAQDLELEYLLALEPNRMLAFLRRSARLEPKAQGYGGWDGDGRQLTGHITGHHFRALAWIADEKKTTVRFEATNGRSTPSVFGVRIVRSDIQR